MQTMWTFSIGRFQVRAEIKPCYGLDLSWDESGEVAEKLDNGIFEAFDTRVTVYLNGVKIGENWLCESIYENPEDFFTEHYGLAAKSRADGVTYGAYFPGMVSEAIAEARAWLADAEIAA